MLHRVIVSLPTLSSSLSSPLFCQNLAQSNATAHPQRLVAFPDVCADYTCRGYCHRRLLYDCMHVLALMYHGDLGAIALNLGGASIVMTHLRCLVGFPGCGSLCDKANSGFAALQPSTQHYRCDPMKFRYPDSS